MEPVEVEAEPLKQNVGDVVDRERVDYVVGTKMHRLGSHECKS